MIDTWLGVEDDRILVIANSKEELLEKLKGETQQAYSSGTSTYELVHVVESIFVEITVETEPVTTVKFLE